MDPVALGSHYASRPCPHRARPAASPVRRGRGAPDPGPARKTDADEFTDAGAIFLHGCGDEGPRPGALRRSPRGPAQAQRRDSGPDNARPIYIITTPRCHNQNPVDFRAGADPADGARAGAGRVRLA